MNFITCAAPLLLLLATTGAQGGDDLTYEERQEYEKKGQRIENEVHAKVGQRQIGYLIDIYLFTRQWDEPGPSSGTTDERPDTLEEAAAYVVYSYWEEIMRQKSKRTGLPIPNEPNEQFDRVYEEVLLEPCRAVLDVYAAHKDYYDKAAQAGVASVEYYTTSHGSLVPLTKICEELAEEGMKQKVFAIVDRDVRDPHSH